MPSYLPKCLDTGLLPDKYGRKNNTGAAKEKQAKKKVVQEINKKILSNLK